LATKGAPAGFPGRGGRAFALPTEIEAEQRPSDNRHRKVRHLPLHIDRFCVIGLLPGRRELLRAFGHHREVLLEFRRTKGRVGQFALPTPERALAGDKAIAEQDTGAVVDRSLDVVVASRPQDMFNRIRVGDHHQPVAKGQSDLEQRPIRRDQRTKGFQQILAEKRTDRPDQRLATRAREFTGSAIIGWTRHAACLPDLLAPSTQRLGHRILKERHQGGRRHTNHQDAIDRLDRAKQPVLFRHDDIAIAQRGEVDRRVVAGGAE
jgi:hypothetical protein